MTRLVIDLKDDPQKVIEVFDYGQAQTSLVVGRLLTALKDAVGQRVIVLDVDELGLDDGSAEALRVLSPPWSTSSSARAICEAVADQMDQVNLQQYPWAKGGTVVMVGDDVALRMDNGRWKCSCGIRHTDQQVAADLRTGRARVVES